MMRVARLARHETVVFTLLGALSVSQGHGADAPPFPHSTAELLRPAQVTAIALSPSGGHVAFALRGPGSKADVIRVVKVEQPDSMATISRFELVASDQGARVKNLRWVDDARVIAEIGTNQKQLQQRVRSGSGTSVRTINRARLYSFDALRGGSGLALDERLDEGSIVEDASAGPGSLSVQTQETDGTNLYRLEAASGHMTMIEAGDPVTCCWRVSGGRAELKVNRRPNGVAIYQRPTESSTEWVLARSYEWVEAAAIDAATIAEAADPRQSFVRLRRSGADKYGVHVYDWSKGELISTVGAPKEYDLDSALVVKGRLLATEFTDNRFRQEFVDPGLSEVYQALEKRFEPGTSVRVFQLSLDTNRWLLRASGPRHPSTYHVFDAPSGRLLDVFADYPELDSARLAPVSVLRFVTRDKLNLTAYLTCPAWRGDAAMPLVVVPPPGPLARSSLRFDPAAQAFAAQGWCVLEPNYRGVTGYGRQFEELGYGQWSTRIAQDIADATMFAVDSGIARRDAVAVFARRLGAYAALSAAIQNPGLFQACATRDAAVDLDRVVNELKMTYERISPIVQEWARNQGDEDRRNSPIVRSEELFCPMLLMHREGANEISIAHSESLAKKLWPAPMEEIFHRLPNDRTWTQEADNERETIERAIVHFRKYLPHGVDTALQAESASSPESVSQEPFELPPAAASLHNCIQPSAVDRETCLGRIRLRMPRNDIEAVLGPPDAASRDNTTLRYGDRYLKLDAEGRLVVISDKPL